MKVLGLILIALASVSCKGSGPYLPSGWRPVGPAFFLPSEIAKPQQTVTSISDLNLQGSEASGSDFLQEYGPPKVQDVSQNLINQGLPDVVIEQDFGFVPQNAVVNDVTTEKAVEVSEVKPVEISTEVTATESQSSLDDNPPISAELPILDFAVQEATVASVEPTTELENVQTPTNQEVAQVSLQYQQESSTALVEVEKDTATVNENSNAATTISAVPATVAPSELNAPVLQNIPDIIASLEKEILTQQAEINQAVSEIASVQGVSGSLEQVPEGFLEYGPPGFTEYGPPKGDQEKSENLQTLESNEARKRRFSPKFRPSKKH